MARPSLTSLQTFLEVARHGGLSGAAQTLHKTQSAVSHQLRQLESNLGVALTTRAGRNIRLTAIGQQLAKGLETGFSEIDKALEDTTTHQKREVLHINCVPSVAVRWLIPRLAGFREQFPDYRIDFRYTGALDPGIPTDADIKITWCDGTPQLIGKDLSVFRCDLAGGKPALSPELPGKIEPRTLARMEIFHDEFLDPWYQWFKEHGLNTQGLEDGVVFQDFNLLSAAAVSGQGVALCPPLLIDRELSIGALVTLFDNPVNTDRGYWLFYRENSRPAVFDFVDWITREASEESG